MTKIPIQTHFRPALTLVGANKDYWQFREILEKIDDQIRTTGLESLVLDFATEKMGTDLSVKQMEFAIFSFRAQLLRTLLGEPSFRDYSKSLASSDVYADFCGIRGFEGIRWSSKSTLERASKYFSSEQLRFLHESLLELAGNEDCCSMLKLEKPVDASICLIDSTCLEANIHFPVDWVLLKDVSITLLKAIKLIRKHGVRNRMSYRVDVVIKLLNQLCIEMAQCRRKKDSLKQRKRVFREMKKLLYCVQRHALVHRNKLLEKRGLIELSEAQINVIVERVDRKLELIPKVVKQAHERIIGGRKVQSSDKILSAHEPDIHVMVRGKASGEVEFGNGLCVVENPDGFILDYEFYQQQAPSDRQQLIESLERQNRLQLDQDMFAVVGDRGFDASKTKKTLRQHGIKNLICPRDVATLRERMQEAGFVFAQRRRAGTEARIAIIKNHARSRVCRSKGFNNRSFWVHWAVMAHNMVWIARKVIDQQKQADALAAA